MLTFTDEVVARFWNHGETHASCTVRCVSGVRVHQAHISWFPNTMFPEGRDFNKNTGRTPIAHRTARPAVNYKQDRELETGPRALRRVRSQAAYDAAKTLAQEKWALVTQMSHYVQRKEIVQEAIQDVEYELEHGGPRTDERTTELRYAKRHLDAVLAAVEDPNLAQPPVYPAIDAMDSFDEDRARASGQKRVDDGLVTSAAAKVCVPGAGSIVNFQHVRGQRVIARPVDPAVRARESAKFPEQTFVLWGLNLHAILAYWTNFVSDDRHGYQFASTRHNCAGVVFSALKAGGVGAYVSTETGWLGESVLYVTPKEVRGVIDALMAAILGVNRDTQWFMTEIRNQTTLFNTVRLVNGNLWSKREFAEASRSPNTFSLRREQVAKIDTALAAYHAAGRTFTPQNFETKLFHLLNMMYYVCEHRRQKPQSDRRTGVDSLGVQICLLMMQDPIGSMYNERLEQAITRANSAVEQRIERIAERQARP